MDNRIIVFFASLAAVGLALLVGTAVGSEELQFPVLIIVITAGLLVLAKPELSTFLAVALYAAGLTAPGLPGQFNLYDSAILAVGLSAIFSLVFKRSEFPRLSLVHWVLGTFCTIVLGTGLYRGLGFQFLGSSMWGGFNYVNMLLPATLVLTFPLVNMPASWWRPAIVLMGVLAPIPLVADLLVSHGFSFGIIHLFLQNGATIGTLMSETESGSGLGRLTSAGVAAQSMIIAFLAVFHTSRLFLNRRSVVPLTILLGLTILSLLSGFRLMTATLLFVVLLAAFYQKTLTGPRVIFSFMVVSLSLVALYAVSDHLPYSIQRAVSWLPGISVSSTANQDAEGTIVWRLDLWKESLNYLPEYFWIGKGFSYDAGLYLAAMHGYASYDALNWALVTGAYHNGYLSLLLGFGIFGFLTGLPLLVMVVVRHLRWETTPWNDPVLRQCHQAFLAAQTCLILVYLTVYGDVSAVFPQFFFNWAVMGAIRQCDQRSAKKNFPSETEYGLSPSEDELAVIE